MSDALDSISRREFSTRLTILGSLVAVYPAAALAEIRSHAGRFAELPWLEHDPWKTIAAVQEHLFPAAEDTPGASDFGAVIYLRKTLENSTADGEYKEFVFNGVGWLNDLTQTRFEQPFTALGEREREKMLREIERSKAGRRWLSRLLTYLLEALLADPVYGGNREGLGWRWLEHKPGYPAPPADKTWYRLAARADTQRAG